MDLTINLENVVNEVETFFILLWLRIVIYCKGLLLLIYSRLPILSPKSFHP
jgi:hypothetical protein